MSSPTFLNPFARGGSRTGEEDGALVHASADVAQSRHEDAAVDPKEHRTRARLELMEDELAMALLAPPVPHRDLPRLSSDIPAISPWPKVKVEPQVRRVREVAAEPPRNGSGEAPERSTQSVETKRSRKGSLSPLKSARTILSPAPFLKKVVDLLKPKERSAELRRAELRDLLARNRLPESSTANAGLVPPARPPRPPSIEPEVLDLMGKIPFPGTLISNAGTARKARGIPGQQTQASVLPEIQTAFPVSGSPPRPPPKAPRIGGSLPVIPHVRQKIGVAPDPRGRPRRPLPPLEPGEHYWDVVQVNRLRVPLPGESRWLCGGVLGQGGFGTVYLVYDVKRRLECAMKVVHYSRGLSEGCCRGTINELKVLRRLAEEPSPAPFLLQPYLGNDLWAWRSKGEYLHIMTEVCMGGDLSFYEGRLSEDMLALVSAEVILGLNHLHRLGIVHHDIKPQNVLVNAAGHCVISDYGGAQFLDRWKRIARVPGSVPILTLPFAAPELVSDNDTAYPTYDRAIDYWSLGATLVSLLMDHALLPDARDMTLHTFRLRRIEKKMQDCEISEKLQGFVIALLEETPSRRPMYPDVCKVPFLRELDWEAVKDQRCPPFTVVKHLGVLAHGFQIDAPPLYETRIPVDFVQRLRQEQLSLVVDNSYDVKAHDAAITSVL